MKVLITGMSGTGKSTVLTYLKQDGHVTVDLDEEDWIIYDEIEKDYLMDINKIKDYITQFQTKTVFLAGTTINQKELYSSIDFVITLTAPLETMKERIYNRTNNPFGKTDKEWLKIANDKKNFEARLIKGSDFTISTDKPIKAVLKEIYRVIS